MGRRRADDPQQEAPQAEQPLRPFDQTNGAVDFDPGTRAAAGPDGSEGAVIGSSTS